MRLDFHTICSELILRLTEAAGFVMADEQAFYSRLIARYALLIEMVDQPLPFSSPFDTLSSCAEPCKRKLCEGHRRFLHRR